jgi:hypothetical protein
MRPVKNDYVPLKCVGVLLDKNNNSSSSLPVLDATEAHIRNKDMNPASSIVESACGFGNNICVYNEDCSIKDNFDDFIYENLNNDIVIAVEVRWCAHYMPKNYWSRKP